MYSIWKNKGIANTRKKRKPLPVLGSVDVVVEGSVVVEVVVVCGLRHPIGEVSRLPESVEPSTNFQMVPAHISGA